jgi:HJR/Mrr/RecB family endonuclease
MLKAIRYIQYIHSTTILFLKINKRKKNPKIVHDKLASKAEKLNDFDFFHRCSTYICKDPSYMLAQRQKIELFVFARRPSFQAIQVMID